MICRRRDESGGALGAVVGVVAAVLAIAWVLNYYGEMTPEEFFGAIADWLDRVFTFLFG